MYFLGYHGTSEVHALNIIANGVLAEKLSPNGQIGKGFYIAKINGALPDWGAQIATTEGRNARRSAYYANTFWKRVVLYLTDKHNLPVSDQAKCTILKVYSTRPLTRIKWSVMKISSLEVIQQTGGVTDEIKNLKLPEWIQMVIPVEEIKFLVCVRDDGVLEPSRAWLSREASSSQAKGRTQPIRRNSV